MLQHDEMPEGFDDRLDHGLRPSGICASCLAVVDRRRMGGLLVHPRRALTAACAARVRILEPSNKLVKMVMVVAG